MSGEESPLLLWEKGGDNGAHQEGAVEQMDDILRSVGVVLSRQVSEEEGEGPLVAQMLGKDAFKNWAESGGERDTQAFQCAGSEDVIGAVLLERSSWFEVCFERIDADGKVKPRGGKYIEAPKGKGNPRTTDHVFKHRSNEIYQLEAAINVPESDPLVTADRTFLAPLMGLVVMVAFDPEGTMQLTRDHAKRLPKIDAVRVDGIFPTTFGSVAHEVCAPCSLFLVPCSLFPVPCSTAPLRVSAWSQGHRSSCTQTLHSWARKGTVAGMRFRPAPPGRPCESWTTPHSPTAGSTTSNPSPGRNSKTWERS